MEAIARADIGAGFPLPQAILSAGYAANLPPFKTGLPLPHFQKKGYTAPGVYQMGARVRDPFLMGFLTPDLPEYLDPMARYGLNPYCYCYNDPTTYMNPSGHGVVSTLLHSIGAGEDYNVGTALLWGFGQFEKAAVFCVSGFAFGLTGLWKMGTSGYFQNLGHHGYAGALAKAARDSLVYRAPVRFAISYFANLWFDEWFL